MFIFLQTNVVRGIFFVNSMAAGLGETLYLCIMAGSFIDNMKTLK